MSIRITISGPSGTRRIALPTRWADVTLGQFIHLITEADTAPFAVLTELTAEEIEALPLSEQGLIIAALAFLGDTSDLEQLKPSPGLPTVGAATYGQLLLATRHAEQYADAPPISYAPYLYALYRSHEIRGKFNEAHIEKMQAAILTAPLTEVYADVAFYAKGLAEFYERHAPDESEADEFTDDELDAGADEIPARFGVFATLDALANGDPTKYEQMLAVDADTVLQRIRLAQLQQQVQKNLNAIHAAKQ